MNEENIWSRIERVAPMIGITEGNLDKMRQRKNVPAKHHYNIVTNAPKLGIVITFEELLNIG